MAINYRAIVFAIVTSADGADDATEAAGLVIPWGRRGSGANMLGKPEFDLAVNLIGMRTGAVRWQ